MDLRRVEIIWVDAEVDAGWQGVDVVAKWDRVNVHTLGYVLHQPGNDGDRWILMGDYSARDDDKQCNRPIQIPAAWVRRVTWLD